MTSTDAAPTGARRESAAPHDPHVAPAVRFTNRTIWSFVALGIALSVLAVACPSSATRSYLFDTLSLVAAGGAVVGVISNDPPRRWAWQCVAAAIVLFAAGDVVFDTVTRAFGAADGYPWADIAYLPGYALLVVGLLGLGRARIARETAVDSAVVGFALAAVVWQWAVVPTISAASGPTSERFVNSAYPVMDALIIIVVVLSAFALARWNASAWLLFVGLVVMLVADVVYARTVADGTYHAGGWLDTFWPISYFLLAGAVLHPTMRELWNRDQPDSAPRSQIRVVVLGGALIAAPVFLLSGVIHGAESFALVAVTGATAALVAWRISRVVGDSNRAREVVAASEARFRALVQHSTDIIVVVDRSGRVAYVSPSVSAVFTGRVGENLVGTSFADYLDQSGVQQGLDLYERLLAEPEHPVTTEFNVFDGKSWRWVEATWTNQLDEPAVRGIVGNLREITERKRLDALNQAENEVLELILAGAPVPDTLTRILRLLDAHVPGAMCAIRLVDETTGAPELLLGPGLPETFLDDLEAVIAPVDLASRLSAREITVIRDLRKSVRQPQVRELVARHGVRALWSAPVRSADGDELLGFLGICFADEREPTASEQALLERARDLAALTIDRAKRTEALDHLALHDTLTGLPNRSLALDRIEHAIARLEHGDASMVAVLFIDLDRFKLVNDGMGHETGDELLVAVSRRLTATVRRQDTVARLGGDEFVVLCEDLNEDRQAAELAARIAEALSLPFALGRAEVTVSASVGVAVTERATDRASALVRDADAAMYRAKRRGGSRYELYDEMMHTQAITRLLTERALRSALEHDELRVLFQPQFALATGERVAAEALLRWVHPVRGIVEPGDFIRVAEETGLIVPMGEFVLDEVCRVAALAKAAGVGADTCAIALNLSPRQLQRPDFVDAVRRRVAERGLDAATLCFEVSETTLLEDYESIGETLRTLKDVGASLAVDDFGTGGSSLTYLRRFPFDQLKIDHTFTAGLGKSAADDAIVAATIDMAHAIGISVTAEGVETDEQLARLRELGCDRAQGYLLGPPEELPSPRLTLVRSDIA